MENNRNYIVAIVLSLAILIGWQFFFVQPRIEQERAAQQQQQEMQANTPAVDGQDQSDLPAATSQGSVPGTESPTGGATMSREASLSRTGRVNIDTPDLAGSINLKGARFDDLELKNYHLTVDPSSPIIELLSPANLDNGYIAEFGFVGNDTSGTVPGPDTVWSTESGALTPGSPVVLTWVNDKGVEFTRTISVDEHYLFTIEDSIANTGDTAVSLSTYGRVTRFEKPDLTGIWILHEGLKGYIGEEGLQEITYDDVAESRTITPAKAATGWLGFADKYWATAMVPAQGQEFQSRFTYRDDGGVRYQADFLSDPITIQPGATQSTEQLLFAGAKEVPVIDSYQETYNITHFDLMIDWGWFFFLTKPMFYLLDYLYKMFGNFGISILLTTVIVKLIFFPLANKSYKSMAAMKKFQPKIEELKEKFGDDRQGMQKAMMELYRKEKINPVAGCWPMLLQIPVFFALYKVLYITIEMRHAPFFGWIQDLSAPDPTSIFNLFGLLPFTPPAILMLGIWPLIMGFTMFLQMRMNPTPPDPTQAMIFNWMPVIFTFMLASFPAGLVIYWAWNNTLTILQQGVIMKRQGVDIPLWTNLVGLFRRKPKAAE